METSNVIVWITWGFCTGFQFQVQELVGNNWRFAVWGLWLISIISAVIYNMIQSKGEK